MRDRVGLWLGLQRGVGFRFRIKDMVRVKVRIRVALVHWLGGFG